MELNQIEWAQIPAMPLPNAVLMVEPTYYDVLYAINIHMKDEQGQLRKVDCSKAIAQWNSLKKVIEKVGLATHVLAGQEGLPDMVFSANQSFPLGPDHVLLSQMATTERSGELPFFEKYYRQAGFQVEHFPEELKDLPFESMGDVLWHPQKRLLWCGRGPRTKQPCLEWLSETFDLPWVGLNLIRDEFYHLDTCLVLLDSKSAAYIPSAFDKESKEKIQSSFERLIELDEDEAVHGFAGNAWCADGQHVIIQKDNPLFCQSVKELGFDVIEVDTSEFIKGGGSVFCMKLPLFPSEGL